MFHVKIHLTFAAKIVIVWTKVDVRGANDKSTCIWKGDFAETIIIVGGRLNKSVTV